MALPSSGQISMSQINGEFGRGNDLNSYRGTGWYTPGGSQGYFSQNNISFSEFWDKQPNSPAPSVWMNYLAYSTYGYFQVEITAGPSYAGAYYEIRTSYIQNLGYVDALIATGNLNGNGYEYREFGPISDEYWYPRPKQNCFYVQLSGYGNAGGQCLWS